MLAAYNIRRSSVVLNPRGRVLGGLGGLGGGYEGEGSGIDYGGGDTGGGQTAAEAAYSQQQMAYEAASLEAANAATFAAAQMANEAALLAAAQALAATQASNAASAKTAATIANTLIGFLGPVGMIAGLIGRATGSTEAAFNAALNGQPLSYGTNIANADQALADARAYGGGDPAVLAEINKVQTNIDKVKKASIEAAVTQMYLTYAKRNPSPAELAYWSQRFGPTITSDEVMQFQQVLYANEPNLRPMSYTEQQINEAIRISKLTFSDADVITGLIRKGLTSEQAIAALNRFYSPATAQAASGGGLALPIIAAVAGFLVFGS